MCISYVSAGFTPSFCNGKKRAFESYTDLRGLHVDSQDMRRRAVQEPTQAGQARGADRLGNV